MLRDETTQLIDPQPEKRTSPDRVKPTNATFSIPAGRSGPLKQGGKRRIGGKNPCGPATSTRGQ